MDEVKKLDIKGKGEELYDSLMNLENSIVELPSMEGIQLHYLQNKEINALYNENLNEDDFLEAMLVYFEMIKNMVGEYLISKQ